MSRELLESGLAELGPAPPSEAVERLVAYAGELRRWNRAYNLTAIRDPRGVVVRHLLDSAAVLPVLDEVLDADAEPRLLDVGSGAGLPGLVLAILRPELFVSCVDSVGKKARFMRHAVRELGLDNVEVIEARVEQLEPARPWPLIISRAFAALSDFFRLTMPLLSADGYWLAMKGRDEIAPGTDVAGARVTAVRRLRVPGLDEERHLVLARRAPDHEGQA